MTVTLFEIPPLSGHYEGLLPPLFPAHGVGIGAVVIKCGGPPTVVPFIVYIDPSGTVVDGNHADAPLAGATVTLLSAESLSGPFSPGARRLTSDVAGQGQSSEPWHDEQRR